MNSFARFFFLPLRCLDVDRMKSINTDLIQSILSIRRHRSPLNLSHRLFKSLIKIQIKVIRKCMLCNILLRLPPPLRKTGYVTIKIWHFCKYFSELKSIHEPVFCQLTYKTCILSVKSHNSAVFRTQKVIK